MKALSICQPNAHLIVTPQSLLPPGVVRKRVENRTWTTRYRGRILIHASRSTDYMGSHALGELPLGALVGFASLVDCVRLKDLRRYGLARHPHAGGPWCWVLRDAIAFAEPIPLRGRPSLFEVELTGPLAEAMVTAV